MIVAVTYKDGQVYQHFGNADEFKVYDIQNGNTVNTEIIKNTEGKCALGDVFGKFRPDVVICGEIGPAVQSALTEAGIRFYSHIAGTADDAVARLLDNTIEVAPIPKDPGDEKGHSCGHGCGDCCSSCGDGKCY